MPGATERTARGPVRQFWLAAFGSLCPRLLCLALLCCPLGAVAADQGASSPQYALTLVSNGWHTGLALPPALAGQLAVARDFPPGVWLEIGFGDEAFYREPEPGLATLLRAALQNTPAVLHVFAFPSPPEQTFIEAELRALEFTALQGEALVGVIDAAFARDPAGDPIGRGKGLYSASRFYLAKGSFTLGHTCNTWAAEALEAAGFGISAAGVVTAEDLLRRLRSRSGSPADGD